MRMSAGPTMHGRLEIIVERWTAGDGNTDFLWSLWRDGKRLTMGGSHPTAEAAEAEARAFCAERLGRAPDRITRL
jgi:hypothetical protein